MAKPNKKNIKGKASSFGKKITAYSLAAGSFAVMVNQSDADVIYFNIDDYTLTESASNIDFNGLLPFVFKKEPIYTEKFQAVINNPYYQLNQARFSVATTFSFKASTTSYGTTYSRYNYITTYIVNRFNTASNNTISYSSEMSQNWQGASRILNNPWGGNFKNSEGFIGIKFVCGVESTCLGWIRYQGDDSGGGVVKDWAYENSEGPIKVGLPNDETVNATVTGAIPDGVTMEVNNLTLTTGELTVGNNSTVTVNGNVSSGTETKLEVGGALEIKGSIELPEPIPQY